MFFFPPFFVSPFAQSIIGGEQSEEPAATIDTGVTYKDCLRHARELFVYHATQRHQVIRYSLAMFAAFGAAYVAVLSMPEVNISQPTPDIGAINFRDKAAILASICVALAFAAASMLGLDVRNARLVKVAEGAVDKIERIISNDMDIREFKTIFLSERPGDKFIKYAFIIPSLYLSIFSVSIFGAVYHFSVFSG